MATKKNSEKKDVEEKKVTKKKVSKKVNVEKKNVNKKKKDKIVDEEKVTQKKVFSKKNIWVRFKKWVTGEKSKYNVKEVTIIMVVSLGIGFVLCFGFVSLFAGKNYIRVVKDLDKVIETYYAIVDNYYGELDKNELVDGAVEGMISSVGDVFTSYSNADDTSSFDESITGSYEGIGCTVATYSDGSLVIIDIFEGSPSDKAGLKVGDKIIRVDNESYEDKNSEDMANYIKNSGKDKVIITILREEEEIDLTVSLSKVEIPSVSGRVIEQDGKKIGYISISLFADNSYKQFKNKLESLEKDGIEGLIIDVRDNSGGYLTSATDICNLFLEKGKVIYKLTDSDKDTPKAKKDNTKEKREYDIVVLVNGASASASEIVASAIKESYGGTIVGITSYGKGTVQQTKKLLDGSMIKYTSQKWFTPLGNSVDGIGIVPDVVVELSEEYYNNPSVDTDNQLNEAINLLIK